MSDIQAMNDFDKSIEETLNQTYNDLYESLTESEDVDFIKEMPGMKDRLNRMISHFTSLEEYEKCGQIKKVMEKYKI